MLIQISNIIYTFFSIFMYITIIRFVFSFVSNFNSSNGIIHNYNNRNSKIIKNININFDDVIGHEPVKKDLKEYINYMKYRKFYISSGFKVPKGVLLSGPPGTGKTLLAKALAGETKSSFISVSGSDFIEIYVGVGAKRIRELFSLARKNSPCIIFIDEIDAIGRKRTGGGSGGHSEQGSTLNSLLVEMDGFKDTDEILIIAASNMINVLDPALLRSGRFDKKIVFDKPNINERKDLFKLYLNKIKLHPNFKKNYDNNLKKLATLTANCTGADIANITNQGVAEYMKKPLNPIIIMNLFMIMVKILLEIYIILKRII